MNFEMKFVLNLLRKIGYLLLNLNSYENYTLYINRSFVF
jgi:hypothetical protein